MPGELFWGWLPTSSAVSPGSTHHLGVHGYFASVVGAGDVRRNKPFPDMIHAALREMNFLQKMCLRG